MTIIYRGDKGSPLTATEVDNNFHDLDDRVGLIEDNPVEPVAPVSITMVGNSFTMGLSNGETLGPITFTIPMPLWRGNWAPATNYKEMDFFVPPDGGLGAVMWPHISAATFDWAATDGSGNLVYKMLVGSDGTTAGLSDLNDVALSGLATGDMLAYDAALSLWRNVTPQEVADTLPNFTGDSGSGGERGLVPAPAAGDGAAQKYLRANGTWSVPPTGTGGSSSLAGLSDVSISGPANLELLQFSSGDGRWHNASLISLGYGTVTSIIAGAGLSGGTITASGTISLAPVASQTLFANTTGAAAVPAAVSLTVALDALAGSTRGSLLQRNAIGWQPLAPGSAGTFLKTGGVGADLSWDSPAGAGTVTSITAGAGLSGGTITASGTIAIAPIADATALANVSGASAPPTATTVTALLDKAIGTTRGSVVHRGASTWAALTPGTAGTVLTSNGSGADLSWGASGAGTANVSVGDAPPSSPAAGDLWWSSADGNLYVRYQDVNSTAWVVAVNQPGPAGPTGPAGPAGTYTAGTGISIAGGTIANTLAASGGTVGGTLTVNGNVFVNRGVGAPAPVYLQSARNWAIFAHTDGNLYVNDDTSSTTRLTLDSAGLATLTGALTLVGTAGDSVQVTVPSGQWCRAKYTVTGARTWAAGIIGNNWAISDETAGATRLTIDTSGACSASSTWAVISDMRLKENIQDYPRGLSEILALNPIYYQWNGRGGVRADGELHFGLAAQDVEEVLPELIREHEYVPPEGSDDEPMTLKTYSPTDITFALVNAIKELQMQIDELKSQLPPPMQPRRK